MIKKIFTKITEKLLKAGKAFSKAPQKPLEATQDLTTNKEEKPDVEAHTSPQEAMDILVKDTQDSGMDYPGEMTTSIEGMIEIASHEGLCLTKYKDSVGVWTIAIGATRTEIPDIARWPADKQLSIQECFDLFKKSLVKYEKAVRRGLKVDVPQHAFDALVSWCYNVGTGWVKKATVIKLINKGVPVSDKRIYNALMMYKKPPEIIGRRKKEAILLTTGKYSNTGKVLVFPVSKRFKPIYSRGYKIDVKKYL